MSYAQRYLGRSRVEGGMLSFSPNLARPKVFFDGELKSPVRYREAMSALHEVVIGDLSARPRDKTAYRAYLAELNQEEESLRQAAFDEGQRKALLESLDTPEPKDLKKRFQKARKRYYGARSKWISDLRQRDSKLWWLLDPVVTVAPDVVLFECFSKDESSYACLTVDRDAFSHQDDSGQGLGTTNVDYSFALYEHIQTLRTYRPTQLTVDPQGFEVQVTGHPDFREDKIDLPPSWLRGFGQIQAAQMLPADRVSLPREAVYSLLAYLGRHREKQGPRAIRFELDPGQAPRLVLEPWNKEIGGLGPGWEGREPMTMRVWGRRRLSVLARVLPLVER
ncbi:MAG: SWIM zinc finger family protein, partial [Myxococcales bacterium]|nr:SWIM zinc finger family protein [Myxococcales bacterium]